MGETMHIFLIVFICIVLPTVILTDVVVGGNTRDSTYTRCLEVLYKDKQEDTIKVCKDIAKVK
jgi:hypothetical protein